MAAMLAGCATIGDKVRTSAVHAAKDPWTWGPIAAAGLVTATHTDRSISNWARKETPLFGSRENALQADHIYGRAVDTSAWVIFALAQKRGDGAWAAEKGIDATANALAIATTYEVTTSLKHETQRERPAYVGSRDSFPSARASDAFTHASFGRYYAERLDTVPLAREAAKWTVNALAAAASWARLEAGGHFPTDLLVGAALGNFSSRFFTELLAPDAETGWRITPQFSAEGDVLMTFTLPF